jgi:hypothetical protein
VPEISRALEERAHGHEEVVVDLSGLTFIDTEPSRDVGRTLAIAGIRDRLRWVDRRDKGSSR